MNTESAFVHIEARRGAYADSVTLMQVSRQIEDMPGVRAALVAMATGLNLARAREMAFAPPDGAGPDDLLIAIRADEPDVLAAARAGADAALSAPRKADPGTSEEPPRTIAAALQRGANFAFISVPGTHAFAEAIDALDADRSVMIFSDNIPVRQEVALKKRALQNGQLVLGPDSGTSVISGIGFGFANVVQPGPVGIVAASGTGAQQLMCLLDLAGVGVSACLGVGSRDLSSAVQGMSALAALSELDSDPATELIVLVSKPPDPQVAAAIRRYAAKLRTPVIPGLLARGQPDLQALAERSLKALGRTAPAWPCWLPDDPAPARAGFLRGLFCGGTLCGEAMIIAAESLGVIRSNIPLEPGWRADPSWQETGHLMVDFGEDSLTRGRPHPMIDPALRLQRLASEIANPSCGAVLLDVVLGHGSHPDPAALLTPLVALARDSSLPVVIALVGSTRDPQGLESQAESLRAAGATVFAANAEAARYAVALVRDAPGRCQ
ncbi:MAG TPA: FdrA family protein [Streptosporangiaceae bacterium]|nr:FdrA family protein [Streptosporangiaceae bacterium]